MQNETKAPGRPKAFAAVRLIQFRLPEGEARQLSDLALDQDITMSQLLRRTVRRLLAEDRQP